MFTGQKLNQNCFKTQNQILLSFVFTSTVLVFYPDVVFSSGLRVFNNIRPFARLDLVWANSSQTDFTETITTKNESAVIIRQISENESAKNKSEIESSQKDFPKPEKLFVIVAYRDREDNKNVFVTEMKNYLTRKE